jgi:membrane protease subunit (stomatin/prohibitin family)
MSLISSLRYEGNNKNLVCKSKIEDANSGSQLIVSESQEAVLFRDGQALDLFGPGRHEITSNNLPVLKKIFEKLTNSHTPFPVDVYFVNKTRSEELLWGTTSPIQIEDPKYGILLELRSFGCYQIEIADARKFLIRTVGTLDSFSKEELQDYFRNQIVTKVKTELAKAMVIKNISIFELPVYQEEISEKVKQNLAKDFLELGVQLDQFVISSVKARQEDIEKLKATKEKSVDTILSAQAQKKAMDTLGTNYRESKTFDVLEEAATHQASGGLIGAGFGLGIAPIVQETFQKKEDSQKISCPNCKTMNDVGTKFCKECGTKLETVILCPKCNTPLPPSAKFCPNCGEKMNQKSVCPTCHKEITGDMKFCPYCGTKRE